MMVEHYLQQTSILPENHSVETVYQIMQTVFQQHERLIVLLDETLVPDIFDDLRNNLRDDQIIYIPLAKGNGYKDTELFFIEISDEKILKDIGFELAEYLVKHSDIANDRYLVHGFGASQYDNDELNRRFKTTLVLQDIESKILFRWYDPRVMIYLDQIFNEQQLNSLLGIFSQWHFIHPTGSYHWENTDQKKLQLKAINKINVQQSLQLDLIEISNTVFRKAHELVQIDSNNLNPQKILKNLYQAHEQYQIKKYIDLVSYGLYAELLGQGFIQHPHVANVLKQYWNIEPENYNFTEAMNFIAEDAWALIKTEIIE